MNSLSHPQVNAGTQSTSAPLARPKFPFVIFLFVWVLAVIVATLVTFILPEAFSSTARIKIERDQTDIPGLGERGNVSTYDAYFIQTEFELIQSEVVLGKVIADLDLNKEWGKKFGGGNPLKTTETISLLKNRMDLRPVRNTSLVEIRVYSEKAEEAAKIANVVAEAYKAHRLAQRTALSKGGIKALESAYEENNGEIRKIRAEMVALSREQSTQNTNSMDEARRRLDDLQRFSQMLFTRLVAEKTDLSLPATSMVQIVDKAVPGLRPVRPNKPLNIALGILLGGLGGLFLATLVYVLHRRAFRREAGIPRTPLPPRFRAIVHILIALTVGFIVGYYCGKPFALSTIIVVPLALLVGAVASAYIELANVSPIPASAAAPGQAKPNDAALEQ